MGKDKVAAMALRLPAEDRAELATDLMSSLQERGDPEAERLCLKEVSRRCALFRKGAYKEISAASVLRKVKALLR